MLMIEVEDTISATTELTVNKKINPTQAPLAKL